MKHIPSEHSYWYARKDIAHASRSSTSNKIGKADVITHQGHRVTTFLEYSSEIPRYRCAVKRL